MATNKKAKKKTAPKRRTKKGVREAIPGTIAGKLWAICDKLQDKLGRPPARFEYREAVAKQKESFNHDSVSYQFFQWRKFNGVKARSTGRYPSRGSFKASKSTTEREASKKTAKKKKTTSRKK